MVNDDMMDQKKSSEINPEKPEPRMEIDPRTASGPRPSPGQWLRAAMGIDAPFGHDGLPTVWG